MHTCMYEIQILWMLPCGTPESTGRKLDNLKTLLILHNYIL